MELGTAFHSLLEAYHGTKKVETPKVRWESDLLKLYALFDGYMALYAEEPLQYVEHPFNLIIDGHCFKGILDGYSAGRIYEHKTTSMLLDNIDWYWDRTKTDIQVGLYQLAAMDAFHLESVSVVYNVIRIPQQRKGKNETVEAYIGRIRESIEENPEDYFARREIAWSPRALEELRKDLLESAGEIEACTTADVWLRNRSSCFAWKRRCEFYEVCHEGKSTDDPMYYQIRSKR